MKDSLLPTPSELDDARKRLASHVHRTPLLSSRSIAVETGAAAVRLKCENLQRTGSFKIRGALNAVLLARDAGWIGPGGLITYSSGNHGQAVARAAQIVGVPATVVVPEDIPAVKEEAIAALGATTVRAGRTSDERHRRALEIARETGARVIPPFDDPAIIAGQAGVGLEIIDEFPEVEDILVPVGGGGLIGGIALAAASRSAGRERRVIGVEPESADALRRSLEAGELVTLTEPPRTIADGLRPVRTGDLPFRIARDHVAEVLLVDDDAIRAARRLLLERSKLFVEPSGAATIAALLTHRERFAGRTVVAVLSGGNAPLPEL